MDFSVSFLVSVLRKGDWVADSSSEDGNIGVIQTMVGEPVHKPEHERKSAVLPTRKNSWS